MIGTPEILLIVAVILVLFGASQIPKFARSIGKAKGEFKKGIEEAKKEVEKSEEKDNKDTKDKKEEQKTEEKKEA